MSATLRRLLCIAVAEVIISVYLLHRQSEMSSKRQQEHCSNSFAAHASSSTNCILAPFRTHHNFSEGLPRARRCDVGLTKEEVLNYTFPRDSHYVTSRRNPFAGWMQDRHYSAAWLSSVTTLLSNPRFSIPTHKRNGTRHPYDYEPDYDETDLEYGYLEYGTFAAILWKSAPVFRSIDLFDFYVHHLSQWPKRVPIDRDSAVFKYFYHKRLGDMEQTLVERGYNNPNDQQNGQVLVIMPFHSFSDHHSLQDDKFAFLNLTVKAVSNVFPNIIVSVCNQHDYDYVTKHSGLNHFLYDVMLLPISEEYILPLYSSIEVRRRIETKIYTGFEWIYFTEADQPVFLRNVNWLLQLALREKTILVPHRTFPSVMPEDLGPDFAEIMEQRDEEAKQFYTPLQNRTVHNLPDIRSGSCCFDSQFLKEPSELKKNDKSEKMIFFDHRGQNELQWFRQYDSFAYIGGTCNRFHEFCARCKYMAERQACPHPS